MCIRGRRCTVYLPGQQGRGTRPPRQLLQAHLIDAISSSTVLVSNVNCILTNYILTILLTMSIALPKLFA